MGDESLRRLVALEEKIERQARVLLSLEHRQSTIIGVLVDAGLWEVDPSTGRSREPAPSSRTQPNGGTEQTGTRTGGQAVRDGGARRPPSRDPKVHDDPPRWKGESMKGRRFSETSSAYMKALASYLDWLADTAAREHQTTSGGRPRAPYILADAQTARAWSLELGHREDATRAGR